MGVRSCTEGCSHDNAQYLPRATHNEAGTLESNFADQAVFSGRRFILSCRTGCILTGNKGCNSNNIVIIVSNVTHLRRTVHFCGRLSKHNGKPIEQTKKKIITESNMPMVPKLHFAHLQQQHPESLSQLQALSSSKHKSTI